MMSREFPILLQGRDESRHTKQPRSVLFFFLIVFLSFYDIVINMIRQAQKVRIYPTDQQKQQLAGAVAGTVTTAISVPLVTSKSVISILN